MLSGGKLYLITSASETNTIIAQLKADDIPDTVAKDSALGKLEQYLSIQDSLYKNDFDRML